MTTYLLDVLKEKTESLFTPLMKVFAKTKIHPNFLTLLSFLTGLIAVFNIQNKSAFIIFGVFTVFFDILDGHLARYIKRVTKLGKHLDMLSDRTIELLLILLAPVNVSLMLVVLVLFVVHHVLYYWVENIFFTRTLLIIFFALQLFEVGMYVSLVVYIIGTLWQVRKLIKEVEDA